MLLVFIVVFALAGNAGAQVSAPVGSSAARSTQSQPTPKLLSAALASPSEDSAAESELLELANQRRREAGVAPLRVDEGLTNAARAHARMMVDRQRLSHQFEGERSLMPRLHDAGLWPNSAGENVAYHASVEKAFESLMQSPPHRQNLLDPDFNVAGMAAFWSGGGLYLGADVALQFQAITPDPYQH